MMSYHDLASFAGTQDELEEMFRWRAGSIRVLRNYGVEYEQVKGARMQYQLTIEVRVDFADKDKNVEIKKTAQQCARRLLSTCQLISDNQKATRVAIWADDFFKGHEEIALLEDILGEVTTETINEAGETPSDELLGALKNGV